MSKLKDFATAIAKYDYIDEGVCPATSEFFDESDCPHYSNEWCYGHEKDCIKVVMKGIIRMVERSTKC